jgi:hypothetical protein
MLDFHEAGDPDLKPHTTTFNSIMTAWAKNGDPLAGKRAEAILERMAEMSKEGNGRVRPDVVSYNAVISTWANGKSRLGAQSALAYLEQMKKLAAAGHAKCKPDKFTYTAVVRALSNSDHPDAKSTVQKATGRNEQAKKVKGIEIREQLI